MFIPGMHLGNRIPDWGARVEPYLSPTVLGLAAPNTCLPARPPRTRVLLPSLEPCDIVHYTVCITAISDYTLYYFKALQFRPKPYNPYHSQTVYVFNPAQSDCILSAHEPQTIAAIRGACSLIDASCLCRPQRTSRTQNHIASRSSEIRLQAATHRLCRARRAGL